MRANSIAIAQAFKLNKTLAAHTGYVLSIAFSPDGNTLASSSRDKTIKLWTVWPQVILAKEINSPPQYETILKSILAWD